MKIQVCSKCKKRPASVFITRLENGNSTNEGLCFQCAAELGIKPPPVMDMLKKMGIDEDAIQNMSEEISGLVENGLVEVDDDNSPDGTKVPTLNLGEIFGLAQNPPSQNGKEEKGKRRSDKKEEPSKKLLST